MVNMGYFKGKAGLRRLLLVEDLLYLEHLCRIQRKSDPLKGTFSSYWQVLEKISKKKEG